LDKFSLWCLSI